MLGRPKFTADGIEYLVLPTKAAWNNIKFEEDGKTWYVPLVHGTAGGYSMDSGINFKLGYFTVSNPGGTTLYAATGVEELPEITVLHQPHHVRKTRIFPINPLVFAVSDPDNDYMTVKLSSSVNVPPPTYFEDCSWYNIRQSAITYSGVIHTINKNNSSYNIELAITCTDEKGGRSTQRITSINEYSSATAIEQFENKLYWIDKDNTWYTGTRSGDTINITSHNGSGTPYQYFTGFSSYNEGKKIKWDIYDTNGVSVKTQWLSHCDSDDIYENPEIEYFSSSDWHLVTQSSSTNLSDDRRYGVKICRGYVPNGEYDLVIVVDDTPKVVYDYGVHLIINDPSNPAGGSSGTTSGSGNVMYFIGNGRYDPRAGDTLQTSYTVSPQQATILSGWVGWVTTSGNAVVRYGGLTPYGTTYVVDSVVQSWLLPGSNGGNNTGYAGGKVYKCTVHSPS